MLASLRTKFWLPTFYVFFRVISKKRKKSCFLKSEKNEKYVFSNTALLALTSSCFPKPLLRSNVPDSASPWQCSAQQINVVSVGHQFNTCQLVCILTSSDPAKFPLDYCQTPLVTYRQDFSLDGAALMHQGGEAPKVPRGVVWGEETPPPCRRRSLPRKFLMIQSWNGAFWCTSQIFWCYLF